MIFPGGSRGSTATDCENDVDDEDDEEEDNEDEDDCENDALQASFGESPMGLATAGEDSEATEGGLEGETCFFGELSRSW